MRVGIGYDIHPLAPGRKLILGGIEIPHTKGLDGHSDADVLTHAVCDALLGAMGEGDLGVHFPASDQRYKDISSLKLLESVMSIVTRKGCRVVNVDAVINFFFFSSRRRHTRSDRDWSSDVCSSD